MHLSFLPIAACINRATTLLSTPPDKAQITLSFLTIFFISLIILVFSETNFQCFLVLQILKMKFLKIILPFSVCVTSG